MFYLMMHSTHFIYGYMASDMVKDQSDSEKGNQLPPQRRRKVPKSVGGGGTQTHVPLVKNQYKLVVFGYLIAAICISLLKLSTR